MKALQLDQDDLIDFQLYGIITAYNDPAQFVYHVNRFFEARFERCDDLDVVIDEHLAYYPVFEWEDPFGGVIYSIIKNSGYTTTKQKNDNLLFQMFDLTPAMLPQYKDYNFLLRVENEDDTDILISENQFIQKITKLRTEKVKFIERLIF